jgi:6-phosphogluconolactonase
MSVTGYPVNAISLILIMIVFGFAGILTQPTDNPMSGNFSRSPWSAEPDLLRSLDKPVDSSTARAKKILSVLRSLFPLFFLFSMTMPAATASDISRFVYFGTYTKKDSKGIYLARFGAAAGTLTPASFAAPGANPTFLALHPHLPVLYAIGERKNESGGAEGTVSAFSLDPADGSLTPLNTIPSGGGGLCYIQVDPSGQTVLVSSYGTGYVATYSLAPDGRLGDRQSFVKHSGKGPHPQQDAAHAHCIDVAPGGRFAFSADLGADKIIPYRLDAVTGALTLNDKPLDTRPGAGPRHLAFHPNGRFAYVINELNSTVTAFSFDKATGSLGEIETVDSIPGDYVGRRWGSEIAVHPSGKFLYASNRADHESIALFTIAAATGKLTLVAHSHEGIKHPRHFAIDPSGLWLLCANHDTDNVNIFRIDASTGRLTPTGRQIAVPSPVCILFAR